MTNIPFKQFKSDYEKYYNEKLTVIKTEDSMDIVISDLYYVNDYEVNWENNTIEIY